MKIIDCSSPASLDDPDKIRSYLHDEEPVALFINGRHISTVLLAPGDIREYVTGFLFTEQYIQGRREIESIRVEKNRASVITTNIFTSPGPKKTILSGCGGAVSYIDPGKLPVLSTNFSVPAAILISSLHHPKIRDAGPKNQFFSALCREGHCQLCRQDIGEDQVTDRMIGAALMQDLDLSASFCICSNTITSETVRKCLLAGIPVIITTRVCTNLAVEIGQKNGLCIGEIRENRILIYSRSDRITM